MTSKCISLNILQILDDVVVNEITNDWVDWEKNKMMDEKQWGRREIYYFGSSKN